MSYSVHLYRKEVAEKCEEITNSSFFENESNMMPFSEKQKEELRKKLQEYKYKIESKAQAKEQYCSTELENATALLTDIALYFSTTNNDGIFEILMTASEFTDSGEFAKYDPQIGEWEDI